MLELPIKIIAIKRPELKKLAGSFRAPIMHFLYHRDDTRHFLPGCTITDTQAGTITHLITYSPANLKKVMALDTERRFTVVQHFDAHSVIRDGAHRFLIFVDDGMHCYRIDMQKKTCTILLGEDLPSQQDGRLTGLGSTCYIEPNDPMYFIYTAALKTRSGKYIVHWYRAKTDLSSAKIIYRLPVRQGEKPPHATRPLGKLLWNSEFLHDSFILNKTGAHIRTRRELARHVLWPIYLQFCRQMQRQPTTRSFDRIVRFAPGLDAFHDLGWLHLAPDFALYIQTHYGEQDFKQVADSNPVSSFRLAPGRFLTINRISKKRRRYYTSVGAPAHFEFHPDGKSVYTSSHNFANFFFYNRGSRRLFFGPAVIDRWAIARDGTLKKIGSFSEQSGYRFTNHRVFTFAGRTYLATIGEPNRLFVVDAESLATIYHADLGKEKLSPTTDYTAQINTNYSTWQRDNYTAFEVSHDGAYLWLIGRTAIVLWSMAKRRIVMRLPLTYGAKSKAAFLAGGAHCQYFV